MTVVVPSLDLHGARAARQVVGDTKRRLAGAVLVDPEPDGVGAGAGDVAERACAGAEDGKPRDGDLDLVAGPGHGRDRWPTTRSIASVGRADHGERRCHVGRQRGGRGFVPPGSPRVWPLQVTCWPAAGTSKVTASRRTTWSPAAPTGRVPRTTTSRTGSPASATYVVVSGSASGVPSTETRNDAVPVAGSVGDDRSAGEADHDLAGATGGGRAAGADQELAVLDGPRLEAGGESRRVAGRRHVGPAAAGRRRRRGGRRPPRDHPDDRASRRRAAARRAVRAILMRASSTGSAGCEAEPGRRNVAMIYSFVCLRGSVPRFGSRFASARSSRSPAGVVLAAFVFYLLVWTNHQTAAAQDDLLDDFHAEKEHARQARRHEKAEAPESGDGLGILHIPALGEDWEWVIVEGVGGRRPGQGPGPLPRHRAARRGRQLRGRRPPLDPRRAVRQPRPARGR